MCAAPAPAVVVVGTVSATIRGAKGSHLASLLFSIAFFLYYDFYRAALNIL